MQQFSVHTLLTQSLQQTYHFWGFPSISYLTDLLQWFSCENVTVKLYTVWKRLFQLKSTHPHGRHNVNLAHKECECQITQPKLVPMSFHVHVQAQNQFYCTDTSIVPPFFHVNLSWNGEWGFTRLPVLTWL